MIKKDTVLPYGYYQLPYIEGVGNNYIDTNFKPNSNTRVVMDLDFLSYKPGNSAFFGARTSATKDSYMFFFQNLNMIFLCDYGGSNLSRITIPNTNPLMRIKVDYNKTSLTLNDINYIHNYNDFQCQYNMYLMSSNQSNSLQWFCYMKLYSCKIYDNEILIRDYIPCMTANFEKGVYDLINKTFTPLSYVDYFETETIYEDV